MTNPNEHLDPDEDIDYAYEETIPLEPHEYYKVHKIKHPKHILNYYTVIAYSKEDADLVGGAMILNKYTIVAYIESIYIHFL